ncbi:3,4-dihydroxy-2-butanone-4-phosphate synthase [Staphylococcus carnosus]|uniref:3,4-dihydroxy-2-butanone-4-phosphate synthase n=1 Tax=Staphylococcus carnosus TaxID=1281 RepID=UPI0020A59277|nr:3,4-dihydroxy-2-butanone-4-phosphate synthase [Staphylococcus carnosus]UTB81739.1 bifunctional 3,4-dihydroxy-2-butanone 4-phosphate synthase/GTP cyclohydrolase II [Staphylococcus carnosus]
MMFDSIEAAVEELRKGNSVIVVDNEDRENEGDLIAVTEFMDDNTVNFMAQEGRGLICAPLAPSLAKKLNLTPMVKDNSDPFGTAFTESVDHIDTTTGISANERMLTAKALISDEAQPEDFNRPGHLFPLIARTGGVLVRNGHTEAAVDLASMTGAKPAGLICEIMNEDGTMAKGEQLQSFKEKHNLKMITIEELVHYRRTHEQHMHAKAKVQLPTDFGTFDMYGFESDYSHEEIVAIVKGDIKKVENVRIHSSCLTGDIFHSQRCDCGAQLEASMKYIDENDGMIIYLPQEGRGIGLINKLKAYELIEQGYDTVTANLALGFDEDLRDYYHAAEILKHFGIEKINLLSNNPEKFKGMQHYGIEVADRIELIVPECEHNHDYMQTKKEKMGHML